MIALRTSVAARPLAAALALSLPASAFG